MNITRIKLHKKVRSDSHSVHTNDYSYKLAFHISSAPGYFQEIMEQLTSDLSGVDVYLDDILVRGKDAKDHLHNFRELLKRLNSNGLRCRFDKCTFAERQVTYLGYILSRDGLAKESKVDAAMQMQQPSKDVSTLRSFFRINSILWQVGTRSSNGHVTIYTHNQKEYKLEVDRSRAGRARQTEVNA